MYNRNRYLLQNISFNSVNDVYCSINRDNRSNIYMLTISNKENVFNLLEKLYEGSKYHLQRKFEIYEKAKLGV